MAETLYSMFCLVFGGGLTSKLVGTNGTNGYLTNLMNAAKTIMMGSSMQSAITILAGIADSLLIIYFLIHLLDHVTKDMLTVEKFSMILVKLVVAMCLVTYIGEIIPALFDLLLSVYKMMASHFGISGDVPSTITYFGFDHVPTWTEGNIEQVFKTIYGKGLSAIPGLLSGIICLILPAICCYIAIGAAYLICLTNIIKLLTYAVFSPIAVTQCFDEITRNAGIKYLKKFCAQALVFSVIIAILWVTQQLQGTITAGMFSYTEITEANFKDFISFTNVGMIITMVIVQFAAIGGMIGAGQIANDVMGV